MASEVARKASQQADNYKRALKYLNECGDLTYEKLRQAHRIAGVDIPESELRMMWTQAAAVLPKGGQPGGTEFLRFQLRNTLIEGIDTFGSLARKLGPSDKRWWQFWK